MFYETNTDELTVSLSQAFEFDSYLDKKASAKRVDNETIAINEQFGIYQGSVNHQPRFYPMQWEQGKKLGWWASFYSTGEEIGSTRRIEFNTYEEALDYINNLIAPASQEAEIEIVETEQEAEITEEEVDQMFWEDMEETMNLLIGKVIYYIDGTDDSERVARLVKFDRSSTCLSDPCDPSDPGCWYSTSSVIYPRLGRQDGWESAY